MTSDIAYVGAYLLIGAVASIFHAVLITRKQFRDALRGWYPQPQPQTDQIKILLIFFFWPIYGLGVLGQWVFRQLFRVLRLLASVLIRIGLSIYLRISIYQSQRAAKTK